MDPSNLEPVLAKDSRLLVAAFYAFTPLDDERREALLNSLPSLAREGSVLGSVLVAHEGVNGTTADQSTALMRCWITCVPRWIWATTTTHGSR